MKLISSLRSWWSVSLGTAALALTSCGGGMSTSMSASMNGSSASACNGSCGGVMMTVTDAPGDFISYVVNVVAVQLTRADGTSVALVPVRTQVDFAQLLDLTEVISAAQVPAGDYVSASITLDYSNAMIVVDNGTTGVTIAASNIINGATSSSLEAPNSAQMTLTLSLGTKGSFLVTPHAIANLALDFNLLASNTVSPSSSNPTTVTVNPILTASVMPDPTKQLRVRGPLVSVNPSNDIFVVNVRPFYNVSGSGGEFSVSTTGGTTYSINGTAYTGGDGLTQLAMLPADTLVAAYGTWNVDAQSFTATRVQAGSSVAGATLATVSGSVIARSGNVLTLNNGLLYRPDSMGQEGSFGFGGQMTVTVGAATVVTEAGVTGSFTTQDISVGQHVIVSGTPSSSVSSSTGMGMGMDMDMGMNAGMNNASFDATAGSVQMTLTSLTGIATAVTPSLVTVNLQSLDGRAVSGFNFAGTGTSTAQDASASGYTVSIPAALQNLPAATALGVSQPVRFVGFVTPYGSAPPDFAASTLVSFANTRATLFVRWKSPGITMPFATQIASGLSISQAMLTASSQDFIRVATLTADPASLSTGLQIDPDMSATDPQFAIAHLKSRMIDNFASFSDFVTALSTEINGTNTVLQVLADGPYNTSTGVFSADQMVVITND